MSTKIYLGYPTQHVINWISTQKLNKPLTFTSTGDSTISLKRDGYPANISLTY